MAIQQPYGPAENEFIQAMMDQAYQDQAALAGMQAPAAVDPLQAPAPNVFQAFGAALRGGQAVDQFSQMVSQSIQQNMARKEIARQQNQRQNERFKAEQDALRERIAASKKDAALSSVQSRLGRKKTEEDRAHDMAMFEARKEWDIEKMGMQKDENVRFDRFMDSDAGLYLGRKFDSLAGGVYPLGTKDNAGNDISGMPMTDEDRKAIYLEAGSVLTRRGFSQELIDRIQGSLDPYMPKEEEGGGEEEVVPKRSSITETFKKAVGEKEADVIEPMIAEILDYAQAFDAQQFTPDQLTGGTVEEAQEKAETSGGLLNLISRTESAKWEGKRRVGARLDIKNAVNYAKGRMGSRMAGDSVSRLRTAINKYGLEDVRAVSGDDLLEWYFTAEQLEAFAKKSAASGVVSP